MSTNPVVHQYTPDTLIAGHFPIVTDMVVIAKGQQLKRGAVLGKITTGGQYKLSVSAADDGSQTPSVVLAEAIDTTDSAAPAPVMLAGEVLGDALQFGTGHTADSVKAALRPVSIYVR